MSPTQAASGAVDSALYVPEPATLTRVEKVTEHEMLFEVELEGGRTLGHAPGQFVQVSVLGIGECPISICSSPTRPDRFELCIRKTGNVTNYLHTLEAGDVIGIRGPLGHGFDVDELHGKDILIVAGGLGLAPVRSLIQYVLDERPRFGQFHILFGGRQPRELLFTDEMTLWREREDVNFHATVDQPDEQWRGKVGVVTTLFKQLPKLNPSETMAVIVGPPVMFKFVLLEVLARGVPQANVYCSLERRMECGIGKCGHCQVNNVYVCMDGPVFKYGQLKAMREAVE